MEDKGLSEVVHLAKENDEEAITELLRRFEPLIVSIHHHYFFHEMDQDDFAQEARVMMFRAVDKYDEDHAVSFAGYYQRCVKNLAVECLRREHRKGCSSRVSRSRRKGGTRITLGIGGFVRAASAFA